MAPTHLQLDPDDDEDEEPPTKRTRQEDAEAEQIDEHSGYWDMSFSSAFSRSLRSLR